MSICDFVGNKAESVMLHNHQIVFVAVPLRNVSISVRSFFSTKPTYPIEFPWNLFSSILHLYIETKERGTIPVCFCTACVLFPGVYPGVYHAVLDNLHGGRIMHSNVYVIYCK